MEICMSEEIRKFLMGEAPFEGVWFGDEHPTRRGKFWWRELLRNEPSQDELWEELEDNCMGYDEGSGGFLVINEAKKRYRITRI